jgi:Na+/H+ antiporter NhaD/arsenite permease-like protein
MAHVLRGVRSLAPAPAPPAGVDFTRYVAALAISRDIGSALQYAGGVRFVSWRTDIPRKKGHEMSNQERTVLDGVARAMLFGVVLCILLTAVLVGALILGVL